MLSRTKVLIPSRGIKTQDHDGDEHVCTLVPLEDSEANRAAISRASKKADKGVAADSEDAKLASDKSEEGGQESGERLLLGIFSKRDLQHAVQSVASRAGLKRMFVRFGCGCNDCLV